MITTMMIMTITIIISLLLFYYEFQCYSFLQVECHPYFRNEDMLQWCKSKQIHVTAYSPLGSPDSASMFKRKAPLLLQDSTVGAVASKLGRSPAQVYSKALANLYPCQEVPIDASLLLQHPLVSWTHSA